MPNQLDVRRLTGHQFCGDERKSLRLCHIVERANERVEQLALPIGRHRMIVLDGVSDATEQVGGEHGTPECAGQQPDAERECARHAGQNRLRETLCFSEPRGRVHTRWLGRRCRDGELHDRKIEAVGVERGRRAGAGQMPSALGTGGSDE